MKWKGAKHAPGFRTRAKGVTTGLRAPPTKRYGRLYWASEGEMADDLTPGSPQEETSWCGGDIFN